MKVILSRKGFDAEAGGIASPILPDGQLVSLPIPRPGEDRRYADLRIGDGRTYADLLQYLHAKVSGRDTCHLDPDLCEWAVPRPAGWRPLSGHRGNAQLELDRHCVGPGDLFLFFGWFRQVEALPSGKLAYAQGAPDLHVVFGYLQIETAIAVSSATALSPWMQAHPHATAKYRQRDNNTLYVSRSRSSWDDGLPGAGPLELSPRGVLTKPGLPRSRWQLPEFFHTLSAGRIRYEPQGQYYQSFRGQEFVIQEDQRVEQWAKDIISAGRCT
jgi:hypothetical protein